MTEPSGQARPSPAASAARPLWTLAGPGLSAVIAACQFGLLIGPLHRAVQRDLGFTVTVLVIVVVSGLVAAAAGCAIGYVLGRRAPIAVVVPALLLVLIGAVVMAMSSTSVMFLAAGLVAGLGGGAVLGAAAGLTGQVGQQPLGKVRLALGVAVFGGLVAGPVLGWFVSTALGWRWAYLLAVPMILVAVAVTVAGAVVALVRGPSGDKLTGEPG